MAEQQVSFQSFMDTKTKIPTETSRWFQAHPDQLLLALRIDCCDQNGNLATPQESHTLNVC